MKTVKGFEIKDAQGSGDVRRIMFIDYKGKDISFNRWRFDLYYAPHLAACHFEFSEADAIDFLIANRPECFTNYSDYRAACES